MVRIPGGRRLLVAVAAASLVPAIVVTGPARAIVTGPTAVDCTGTDDSALQTALTGAAAGQTITIDGMCTGEFTMATGTAIVLQGDPLTGAAEDGFDGETANGPLLAGTDVGATTVRDLIFRNGLSEGDGGALYLDGAVAPTVDGVLFESNQAGGEGGALFVSNDEATATGPMSIVDSTFEDNNTDTYGGAAFVSNWPSITVTGSTFLRNGADAGEDEGEVAPMEPGGGGLYLQVLSDLEGGSIESLDVDADVTITGSTFSGNNTDGSGAGLHVYSRGPESIEIADNTFGSGEAFESNRSELSGGGPYTYSTGPLSLTGNTFEANVAEGGGSEQIGGGGAHVLLAMSPDMTANGTLDAVDNTFFDNASLNDGGGLALQLTEGSTASLTGNDFDANRIDEDDDGGQ